MSLWWDFTEAPMKLRGGRGAIHFYSPQNLSLSNAMCSLCSIQCATWAYKCKVCRWSVLCGFACSQELGGNLPLCDEQDRFVGCYRHKIGGVDTISTILLARYRHDQILPWYLNIHPWPNPHTHPFWPDGIQGQKPFLFKSSLVVLYFWRTNTQGRRVLGTKITIKDYQQKYQNSCCLPPPVQKLDNKHV